MVGDAVWEKIAPLLPGKPSDPGATAKDNRLFLEAVLWRVRTGVPWRDLPSDFGNWNSVFQRFRRWVKGGVVERVFACLSDEPDFEYARVDGTIVPAHPKAIRGARKQGRAMSDCLHCDINQLVQQRLEREDGDLVEVASMMVESLADLILLAPEAEQANLLAYVLSGLGQMILEKSGAVEGGSSATH